MITAGSLGGSLGRRTMSVMNETARPSRWQSRNWPFWLVAAALAAMVVPYVKV
jgi:hypothetical protein